MAVIFHNAFGNPTYVNQTNLNRKLRKKTGEGKQKSVGPWPTQPPLRIDRHCSLGTSTRLVLVFACSCERLNNLLLQVWNMLQSSSGKAWARRAGKKLSDGVRARMQSRLTPPLSNKHLWTWSYQTGLLPACSCGALHTQQASSSLIKKI